MYFMMLYSSKIKIQHDNFGVLTMKMLSVIIMKTLGVIIIKTAGIYIGKKSSKRAMALSATFIMAAKI